MKEVKSIILSFAGLLAMIAWCGTNPTLAEVCPINLVSPLPPNSNTIVRGPFLEPRHHGDEIRPHWGLDLRANLTEVLAMADGRVLVTGEDKSGWGYFIVLEHESGVRTLYAHLEEEPDLSPGTLVSAGDPIGLSNSSGPPSTPPHLHVELIRQIGPNCNLTNKGTDCGFLDPEPCIPIHYMSLSPTHFDFEATQNGPQPEPQKLIITKIISFPSEDQGTLYWNLSTSANWLSVSPSSGWGNSNEITVSVNTTDLAPGTYTATITVSSTDAINSPQYVTVTYEVQSSQALGIELIWPMDGAQVYGGYWLYPGAKIGPVDASIPSETVVEFFIDGESLGEVPIVNTSWVYSPNRYRIPNIWNGIIQLSIQLKKKGVKVAERSSLLYVWYNWQYACKGRWYVQYNHATFSSCSPVTCWPYISSFLATQVSSGQGTFDVLGIYSGGPYYQFSTSSDFQESIEIQKVYEIEGATYCTDTKSISYHDQCGCVRLQIEKDSTSFPYDPRQLHYLRFDIQYWPCGYECETCHCPSDLWQESASRCGGYFLPMSLGSSYVFIDSTGLTRFWSKTTKLDFIRDGGDDYPSFSSISKGEYRSPNCPDCPCNYYSYDISITYRRLPGGAPTSGKLWTGNDILEANDTLSNKGTLPTSYTLSRNYPNPFNPATEISFSLPERTQVSLNIYNILGEKVKTLVNETRDAGTYNVRWDGRDEAGSSVASGIYFYRLQTNHFVETKKMILMK